MDLSGILGELAPILILLCVIGIVLWRLPKSEIEHSTQFRARRRMNWIVLGLTYAFLYFGRYNLSVAKTALDSVGLDNAAFGTIFGVGSIVYGCSFIFNGPLCDKIGGRQTLLIGAIGSAIVNALMGGVLYAHQNQLVVGINIPVVFTVLYAINMYFQSFGAVSIVKVNSAWFHVRERGIIGGIFGILISLGLYFAYDWNGIILNNLGPVFVFVIPAIVLGVMFVLTTIFVRDTPGKAGLEDFNTGDATSDDKGPALKPYQVFYKLITNPIIITIAAIEFCSGFIRNAIMQWGPTVRRAIPMYADDFIFNNWGMVSCCAGILSGIFAGIISDYVFKSRRGPVAAILYFGLLIGVVALFFSLGDPMFGYTFAWMSLCVIGVHGMLSGTATMDFGGSKNAGIATGLIDAFVYLGSGVQGFLLGRMLPDAARDGADYAADPNNWTAWPICMAPFIVVGLLLCIRIRNAAVKKNKPQEPKVETVNVEAEHIDGDKLNAALDALMDSESSEADKSDGSKNADEADSSNSDELKPAEA